MTTEHLCMGGEGDWRVLWPKSAIREQQGIAARLTPLEAQQRTAFMNRVGGVNSSSIGIDPTPTPSVRDRQVGGDHYKKAGNNMQPWDIVDAWGLDFYEGSVLSYLLRSKYKGERLKDLQKIRHYLDKMIEDADAS